MLPVTSARPMGSVDGRRVSVVAEKSMSTSGYSNTRANQGTPRPDLPLPGVLFGLLWVAAAFASLFYCFATNHANKPVVPSEELAIANAAMAPQHAQQP
jgi:hypothetical protein